MSDFWRFDVLAIEGRSVTLRVTARSHDCGEGFPHTLDWMARSLYLAHPAIERHLDEVAFGMQRDDDPEGSDGDLVCWGIDEPDDRLVARVIASMSITLDTGARDEDDGPVGATAKYEVQLTRPELAQGLVPGSSWESPCFDLALPSWWLREGDAWSRVVCDGDSWGHVTTAAREAWSNDVIDTDEDGGYAGAAAFVEEAVRAGSTLVWCNHVGEPSRWFW